MKLHTYKYSYKVSANLFQKAKTIVKQFAFKKQSCGDK